MVVSDLEKWWLLMSLVSLAIMSFGVFRAYVLARRGERNAVKYVPASLLFILGLGINISRHLSLVSPSVSEYALWMAGLIMVIAIVLLELQWRKDKGAGTRK
jgi:hypothetical protein